MEARHSDGAILTISVWTNLIHSNHGDRCVVVMEPVQKIAANVSVSNDVSLNEFTYVEHNMITLYLYGFICVLWVQCLIVIL